MLHLFKKLVLHLPLQNKQRRSKIHAALHSR